MKRTLLFPVILCLLLTACDSNSNSDVELSVGSMRATIAGQSWEAVNATANRVSLGGQTTITVAGATLQAQALSFSVTNSGTGTYTLDDTFTPAGPDVISASYTKAPGQTYVGTSGTIRIDRWTDDGMEGTFSFQTRNQSGETIDVADGAFNVGFGMSIGG